jgi:SAM-dependent methyltransferase
VTSPSARVSAERPFYSRYADAYDLLITDPVEPWVTVVHDRLVRADRPRTAVLDAGCGTGRHAAALIARGHRVDVADASRELLALAGARCPGARALLIDLCAPAPAAGWSRAELSATLRRNGMRTVEITDGVGRRTPDRLFVVADRGE